MKMISLFAGAGGIDLWSLAESAIISAQAMLTQEQLLALRKALWASGKDLYGQILGLWEK